MRYDRAVVDWVGLAVVNPFLQSLKAAPALPWDGFPGRTSRWCNAAPFILRGWGKL
jgi:hypothetical protein